MASRKPQLNIRTDQELIDRIKAIADKERRSISNQVEYILAKYADEYESQEQKKQERADQKDKLSESLIG